MKKKAHLIPPIGNAHPPKEAPQESKPSAESILADAKAKLDGAMEAILNSKRALDLFYNEMAIRQNYINQLPQVDPSPGATTA